MQIIGGHSVENTGRTDKGLPGKPVVFRCVDCGTEGDSLVFSTGLDGCPGNPGSLKLSVCPGGDLCKGHPDTDSAEWRAYKEIPSMTLADVPELHCKASELGVRAARQYIGYADRVGIRFSVWAESKAKNVGAYGGTFAEASFNGEAWFMEVSASGTITAHKQK